MASLPTIRTPTTTTTDCRALQVAAFISAAAMWPERQSCHQWCCENALSGGEAVVSFGVGACDMLDGLAEVSRVGLVTLLEEPPASAVMKPTMRNAFLCSIRWSGSANSVQIVSKIAGNRVDSSRLVWTRSCPQLGKFQKNLGMTPVCPISVPVLRIRRSGVRLPPGALDNGAGSHALTCLRCSSGALPLRGA